MKARERGLALLFRAYSQRLPAVDPAALPRSEPEDGDKLIADFLKANEVLFELTGALAPRSED
jgi:hypothetical protein